MGKEIERKFLVRDDTWSEGAAGVRYLQGYLVVGPPVSVRVRIAGNAAFLTVKKAATGITRDEFEYPIPIDDAENMLRAMCEGRIVEKVRYRVPHAGMVWEVDVFEGDNAGLTVAEIELAHAGQEFEHPPWLGEEVSGDPRYLNSNLSRVPYSRW